MASRFWVGGTGTWDSTTTTHWSTTSGGSNGATAPGVGDDVFIDGGSGAGTVTTDATATGRSLNCGSYTGTLTLGASLSLGDATAGASNIALFFSNTTTLGGGFVINLVSTSTTVQTITHGSAITPRSLTINGAGSKYQFVDAYNNSGGTITLTAGQLDTNGQAVTASAFVSNNGNIRTLTLGASTLILSGASAWAAQTTTNLTLSAASSTITCTAAAAIFTHAGTAGSAGTFGTLNLTGSGAATLAGNNNNAYTNITRTGTAVKTDSFVFSSSVTVTGTLTLTGNTIRGVNRVLVVSDTVGTSRTITATGGAVVISGDVDFEDITISGSPSWTNTAGGGSFVGDCGGNGTLITTNISVADTFNFTNTSGGTMSTVGNWGTGTLHATTARVPLPQDTATLNTVFTTSRTVTVDMPRISGIDFTGATFTTALTFTTTVTTLIFGSLILISTSGFAVSGTTAITFSGRGSYGITSATQTFTQQIGFNAPGATYTLNDNFICTNAANCFLNNGTLTTNSNVTTSGFNSNSGTRTLTMGAGTWSFTGTSAISIWSMVAAGLTLSASSSTIAFTTTSTNTRTFAGAGKTYGTLTYTVAGSTGALVITGANTFNVINFSDVTNARTLTLPSATTTTIIGTFNVNGTSTKLMTVNASTPTSAATLTSNSFQSCDYLSLTDSAAVGAWYAGANSSQGTNVTGWVFTAPPVASGSPGLLMGVG